MEHETTKTSEKEGITLRRTKAAHFPDPTPSYAFKKGGGSKTFWEKHCEKALKHQKTRAIHLARCNPDYQVKYPNECRDNPDRKILLCCHPEAEKRILKEHENILKLSIVPPVDRPTRMNRLG